jgi:hypothetical protein
VLGVVKYDEPFQISISLLENLYVVSLNGKIVDSAKKSPIIGCIKYVNNLYIGGKEASKNDFKLQIVWQ